MESAVLLGTVIAGIVSAIKSVAPERVHGIVTVAVALITGVVLALIDTAIGVADITVAEGIITALGTVGVVTVADRV